jgi:hypothetical protein
MIGTIVDILKTYEGKFRVTFEVDSVDELNGISGMVQIAIKRITKHRSLNANAYFHVLVGKIADKLHISKARAKNQLLGRYGQRELTESGQLIISVRSDIDMMEREDLHCVPVGYGKANETEFTHWAIVRPSHTYDNLEMNTLITGTVDEAKELGIETLTPNELERMKQTWSQS